MKNGPSIQETDNTLLFVKEVLEGLDKNSGTISKAELLNAFMLASSSQTHGTQKSIIEHIKQLPSNYLSQLEPKHKPASNPLSQAIVSTPLLFAARKKMIPFAVQHALPILVSALPGGALIQTFGVPVLEFSCEFVGEFAKGYISHTEKNPMNLMFNGIDNTWSTVSQKLSSLVRRSPALAIEAPALPAIVASVTPHQVLALENNVTVLPSPELKTGGSVYILAAYKMSPINRLAPQLAKPMEIEEIEEIDEKDVKPAKNQKHKRA